MTHDSLLLLLTRRASGEILSDQDQETLEAALLDDPALLDILAEAQAAAQGQVSVPTQAWLVWVQRAAFSGLFFLLFSVGLTLGGSLMSTSSTAFATQDHTFTKGIEREQRAFSNRKRDKS